MKDLEKTIKHFRSLQKRYTTQHDGKSCERVNDAIEALIFYRDFYNGKLSMGKWVKINT